MATVISHYFEGNLATFSVRPYEYASPYEIGFYFILGALAGLVSYLFIKVLYYFEDYFDNKLNIPDYSKPVIGGLIIGLIALVFPQIMGVGYDSINHALKGDMIWHVALLLVFVKIFATSLTLGSGGSGGIFAPSLFMGAMLGYFFGDIVHTAFPAITALPGAYALVAMGGLVAGTTRAPITAIIIVFELTNDYNIILPLMVTCIISTILSSKLSRESIYTLKLLLRNIHIKEGTETNIMESILVKDVYTKEYDHISISDNFSMVVNKVIRGSGPEFPVIDKKNKLRGIISMYDIKDHLFEKDSLSNLLIAKDLTIPKFTYLHEDDNCQRALDLMSMYQLEGLPVVKSDNSQKLSGMVWRKDIQDAYQKEIEKIELTSNLATSITSIQEDKSVYFIEGYSISEITPPNSFLGKSIRELNIRAKYGVDVLSVKTKVKRGKEVKAIPNPNYVIGEDDTLVIAGEIKNINKLKNLN
jgi:CIC family chloride channel protein